MIEVRKLKSSDAAQRNPAIKYVIQFGENRQYFTEKALIELQNKLNIFALHVVVGQSEQLVCQCGKKPKDVPDDGYSYNCNKCRKPFAN